MTIQTYIQKDRHRQKSPLKKKAQGNNQFLQSTRCYYGPEFGIFGI